MPIIGLTGYAGSGKDSAAKGLLALGWKRVAFADGVRDLALKIDPLVTMAGGYRLAALVEEEGWAKAKENPDVRRLLQNIGTGVREVVGSRAWLDIAEEKIAEAFAVDQSVVITDVRFPNECGLIRDISGSIDRQGHIVRIIRPGIGPVNGHISETAIDDIEADCMILNDGTEGELQAKLFDYVESLCAAPAARS